MGIHGASRSTQLRAFAQALGTTAPPADWFAAFDQLTTWLSRRLRRGTARQVLLFDEVPWLASRKSGFMAAFEHFWNAWASRQKRVVVVLCGSAASWMLRKIVRERGGLHNRVTRRVRVEPFSLTDTEALLRSLGVDLGRYQTAELYMALGAAKLGSGGAATRVLDELEESGFIMQMPRLGRAKRDGVYWLADEHSLFYLTWVEGHPGSADGVWLRRQGTPAWRRWSGLAFEATCFKRALGIGEHRPDERLRDGAQLDLVIDRADRSTNLCEMKFSEAPFVVDKA